MGKKFKFKLGALLKIREFKEKKIKQELGSILKDIEEAKTKIIKSKKDINECYLAQEECLKEPSSAHIVQFFPQYIESRKNDQKAQEKILDGLNKKYEEKVQYLAMAKGEVKVLDNLKEKELIKFKKEKEKKFQESIDEIVMSKKCKERIL